MNKSTYALVTLAYWVFMLTDGALRMVVLLHFHALGYSPVQLAFLFLLYECAGIVTNLIGGWVGSRYGLRRTLFIGLALQIVALCSLTVVDSSWTGALAVAFVMGVQALAGVAKDLTKMSSKSAVKLIVNDEQDSDGKLFKWVAALTGSKNAIKGVGFFVGSLLLTSLGFDSALYILAAMLVAVLAASLIWVKGSFGQSKKKTKFTQLFSKSSAINRLSFARSFLFASRDVWFVVGLPIFLHDVLGWDFWQVGGFMAFWVIGYGFVQAFAPKITKSRSKNALTLSHTVHAAKVWIFALCGICALMALAVSYDFHLTVTLIGGLCIFGFIFAINSSIHSYLILAYTDSDDVSLNVGFYYMANACGRLLGTLLSGAMYLLAGLPACLWTAAGLTLVAAVSSLRLPAKLNS
ncbi:organoarsenical effux MFS transporter ArsJ [Rubritalea marina]|uniref:organoarsenical effux MFS transporter ArsJ n=1 Tax=Rubritalea marina TaxID=361055 RepID=UPI00036C5CBF|nr:organoarsenical effux MFS transporter ArsJ [Rubritalea marina]